LLVTGASGGAANAETLENTNTPDITAKIDKINLRAFIKPSPPMQEGNAPHQEHDKEPNPQTTMQTHREHTARDGYTTREENYESRRRAYNTREIKLTPMASAASGNTAAQGPSA
jgi:hypothetical protein